MTQKYKQMSLLEDSLVKPLVKQDYKKAEQMIDGSGMKCLMLLSKSNRDGLLGKMCKALLTLKKAWYSDRCKMTWKVKVSKSNVSLFQLQVSVHGITETEYGYLPVTYPTPTASDIEGGKMGSKTERRSNVPNSKSKRLQGFSNDSSSISAKGKKSKSRAKDSYETNAADTLGFGTQGEDARKHSSIKLHNSSSTERETWWQAQSRICRIPDGVSYGVDRDRAKRIKALGNSIVPQIARQIGLAIMEAENDN